MLVPVCIQFYLSPATFSQLFMFLRRDVFGGGALRSEFGTDQCLRASTSLVPCASSPSTPADRMLKEERETRQIPPNRHPTHLHLGPKRCSGRSYWVLAMVDTLIGLSGFPPLSCSEKYLREVQRHKWVQQCKLLYVEKINNKDLLYINGIIFTLL